MTNYLLYGSKIESKSATKHEGTWVYTSTPQERISDTYNGTLENINPQVYIDLPPMIVYDREDVNTGNPARAAYTCYYWFNADEDQSYALWVEYIRVYHATMKFGADSSHYSPNSVLSYLTIGTKDQDDPISSAWNESVRFKVVDAAFSENDKNDKVWNSSIHYPINRWISGLFVTVEVFGYLDEPIYSTKEMEVRALLREAEAWGPGLSTGLRVRSETHTYPIPREPNDVDAKLWVYNPDTAEGFTKRGVRLVDITDDEASPLRIQTPDGTKSVAFFGRFT